MILITQFILLKKGKCNATIKKTKDPLLRFKFLLKVRALGRKSFSQDYKEIRIIKA
jgi:hypothetical protein